MQLTYRQQGLISLAYLHNNVNSILGDLRIVDPQRLPFVAKITSKALMSDGTTYAYAWTEQAWNPDTGAFQNANSARAGDTTNGPYLTEVNNSALTTFPFYAQIWLRGMVDGIVRYDFDVGQTTGSGISYLLIYDDSSTSVNATALHLTTTNILTDGGSGVAEIGLASATTGGFVSGGSVTPQIFSGKKAFSNNVYHQADFGIPRIGSSEPDPTNPTKGGWVSCGNGSITGNVLSIMYGSWSGTDYSGFISVIPIQAQFYDSLGGSRAFAITDDGGFSGIPVYAIIEGGPSGTQHLGQSGTIAGCTFKGGIYTAGSFPAGVTGSWGG